MHCRSHTIAMPCMLVPVHQLQGTCHLRVTLPHIACMRRALPCISGTQPAQRCDTAITPGTAASTAPAPADLEEKSTRHSAHTHVHAHTLTHIQSGPAKTHPLHTAAIWWYMQYKPCKNVGQGRCFDSISWNIHGLPTAEPMCCERVWYTGCQCRNMHDTRCYALAAPSRKKKTPAAHSLDADAESGCRPTRASIAATRTAHAYNA
jgi:hypothetical protein